MNTTNSNDASSSSQQNAIQPESPLKLITHFFVQVKCILFSSSDFFKSMPLTSGMSGPLTFAVICAWLGNAFSFLWSSLVRSLWGYDDLAAFKRMTAEIYSQGNAPDALTRTILEPLTQMTQVFNWFWGVSGVLLTPFLTLLSVLILSGFIYIGCKLLVPTGRDRNGSEIQYESCVRIISYATAAQLLKFLPMAGGFLSALVGYLLTWIGIREVFRVSSRRANIIALFRYSPQILLLGFVFILTFTLMLTLLGGSA